MPLAVELRDVEFAYSRGVPVLRDVDLSVESIEFPERFPLVSRTRPDSALQRTRARRRLKSVKRSRGARR